MWGGFLSQPPHVIHFIEYSDREKGGKTHGETPH